MQVLFGIMACVLSVLAAVHFGIIKVEYSTSDGGKRPLSESSSDYELTKGIDFDNTYRQDYPNNNGDTNSREREQ